MLVAEKKTEDAINIRRMWLRYTNHTQAIWFYLIPVDEMQHVRLVCWEPFELKLVFPILLAFSVLCVRTRIPNWLCHRRNRSWKRSSSWSDTSLHGTLVGFFDGIQIGLLSQTQMLEAGKREKQGVRWADLQTSWPWPATCSKDPPVFTNAWCGASTWSQFGGSLRQLHTEFFHDRCSHRKSWGCRTLNIFTAATYTMKLMKVIEHLNVSFFVKAHQTPKRPVCIPLLFIDASHIPYTLRTRSHRWNSECDKTRPSLYRIICAARLPGYFLVIDIILIQC